MKKLLLFLSPLFFLTTGFAQTICNQAGNVVLFSNYDGGVLNISIDANVPNLKIGVVSYEPVTINVAGPFVNNITEIRFAGYTPSGNVHCNNSPAVTTINGAPAGTDTIVYTPTSPVTNPNGYSIIICNYSCDTVTSQGGCNTPDQVAAYFLQSFNGLLRSHLTQYGCWTGAYTISNGGNCCVGAVSTVPAPVCAFQSSDTAFCEKQCIDFTDLTTNNPVSWQWYFPGATPDTSTMQHPTNICYNAYGTYDVALVACNAAACDSVFFPAFVEVYQPVPTPLITWNNDTLYSTSANQYAWYASANPGLILSTDSFFAVGGQTGGYFVIITDSNGCQIASAIFTVTGLAEATSTMQPIMLFPNPSTGNIQLLFDQPGPWKNSLCVVQDILGQTVYTCRISPTTNGIYVIEDGERWPEGMYFIDVSRGAGSYRQKFLIQR